MHSISTPRYAIACVLIIGAVDGTGAIAQSVSAPANKPTANPRPPAPIVRQIPFPKARGGGPLQITIDGLSEGISRVGAGRRLFGLCWAGGNPPYSVSLQPSNAATVLQHKHIAGTELTDNSDVVDLQAGSYDLAVSDSAGQNASGRFTVVLPSDIPAVTAAVAAGGNTLAQVSSLVAEGPVFDYEAYLRLLGLGPGDSEAQRMIDNLCHRQSEATIAEVPLNRLINTEILLSDAADLSTPGQSANAAFYYAYLTKQGTLLAEAGYEFETSSANTMRAGTQPFSSVTQLQETTTLIEYGVTDDLSVGGEISAIFETYSTNPDQYPGVHSPRNSDWSDPTFLALYRIFDQADALATAFLRASYSPAVVKNAQQVIDLGGTMIREQDTYTVAGIFDALYTGQSPKITQPASLNGPSSIQLGSDWRYHIALQLAVPLSDRWVAGLASGYQFAYDRPESLDFNPSTVRVGGTPFLSASAGYVVVPDLLSVSLTYQHFFQTNTEVLEPGQSTQFTRESGTDAVTVVLSSGTSIHDLHFGF